MSVRPLAPELQAKAIAELHEDPKRIQDDLKHIKDWLAKQPHIKARTDDQWLLTFLRGCKFSLERTKEKLDMYHTVRTIAADFFANRDPFLPEIQEILNVGVFLPLPKSKDPDSPRIVLLRIGAGDPAKIKVTDVFKVNLMICDILLNEDDQFIICGFEMIQDLKDMTLAHMIQMTPGITKTAMTIFQEAYPTRPKAYHQCNLPSFFETFFNLMKPFLKEKFLNRMLIYTKGYSEIFEKIPQNLWPKEYGGDGPTMEELTAYWKKKVESHSDWYKKDAKYRTTESKRIGLPKTVDDVFGIEGSFRKLNVD